MKINTGATYSIAGGSTTSTLIMGNCYGKGIACSVMFLAKAKPSYFYSSLHSPMIQGSETPRIAGTITDVVTSTLRKNGTCDLEKILLFNLVKKCPNCGKTNATTLEACNSCGAEELTGSPVIEVGNVFSGFILGIEKGPFPLKISLRRSTNEFLVFDDLFAMAPLHFDAIPTCHYIRDWRYLLLDPKRGLDIVNGMFNACCEAASTCLTEQWCKCFINDTFLEEVKGSTSSSLPYSVFDISDAAFSGFNSPPSQFQLHLQFISPVILPHQWALFLKGVHFTKGRFFPREYVVEVLSMMVAAGPEKIRHIHEVLYSASGTEPHKCVNPVELSSDGTQQQPSCFIMDMPTPETLVLCIKDYLSIDYDAYHAQFITKVQTYQSRFARWSPANFDGAIEIDLLSNKAVFIPNVSGSLLYVPNTESSVPLTEKEMSDMIEADKLLLQGYGRPYTAGSNRPIGCYNPFVKEISDIEFWGLIRDNRDRCVQKE